MNRDNVIHSVIVGLCIAIAGISIGLGFFKGRSSDRYVTVKGLAEREVNANLAVWPITFKVAGNDLNIIQSGIEKSRKIITAFLNKEGVASENISYSAPKIRDTQAEVSYGSKISARFRYIAQSTVIARSTDVALIKSSMEKSGKIVGRGIILGEQSWQNPTEFLYTSLNKIKPEMIEEATKSARQAAEKFAKDSGSKVGKIRNASQGYFSINDRDKNSPDVKKIRVVTTVQYYLVD